MGAASLWWIGVPSIVVLLVGGAFVLRASFRTRGIVHTWARDLLGSGLALLLTALLILASISAAGMCMGLLVLAGLGLSIVVLAVDLGHVTQQRRTGEGQRRVWARVVALLVLVLSEAGVVLWAQATGGIPDQLFLMAVPGYRGLALAAVGLMSQARQSRTCAQDDASSEGPPEHPVPPAP
jgi:hypothetical protein